MAKDCEGKQESLFEIDPEWKKEWEGMPEFVQKDLMPFRQIIINFETKEDIKDFAELINQNLTYDTKSIWYPKVEGIKPSSKRYVDES